MPSTITDRLNGLTTSVAVKPACAAVTASNIILSDLQTIGAVTVVSGDRVLVIAQSDATENGIYIADTGDWTRAKDFDGAKDAVQGTLVLVRNQFVEGAFYELTTANPITIGTSSIVFRLRDNPNITYDLTQAEVDAGQTPVDYTQPPGWNLRFGANTTPGTTDMATATQSAIDSASAIDPKVFFTSRCGLGKPLLIRSSTTQGMSLVGCAQAASRIEPLAVNIKVAAQNVNCCIFNQSNNPHFVIRDMEFFAVASFTGVAIYCKEGGGADLSGQALFSPLISRVFVAFPSTNGGFLTGALQNGVVENCTFEGAKGVFTIEGVGHADMHYNNISLFNSFDHFILQTADTNGSFLITVDNLVAYTHMRGRLIDMQNVNGMVIDGMILEPDVANLGNTGLLKFKDCSNIQASNLTAIKRTAVPQCAVGIELENTSIKITGGKISAAVGLLISGTGVIDAELYGVDFTECATAAIRINGNSTGVIKTYGCKFNNSTISAILTSVANGMSWYSYGDEFLNAGLGGSAGARNIVVNTSGAVRLFQPTIGRNNGSAAAGFFIEAAGSGTVEIINPIIVGTAPSGTKTGAQVVKFQYAPTADEGGVTGKTFSVTNGTATTTVNDAEATSACMVVIIPSNAAACTVQGSAKHLRLSARSAGVSFTVTTGDGTNVAGDSNFVYRIIK